MVAVFERWFLHKADDFHPLQEIKSKEKEDNSKRNNEENGTKSTTLVLVSCDFTVWEDDISWVLSSFNLEFRFLELESFLFKGSLDTNIVHKDYPHVVRRV